VFAINFFTEVQQLANLVDAFNICLTSTSVFWGTSVPHFQSSQFKKKKKSKQM